MGTVIIKILPLHYAKCYLFLIGSGTAERSSRIAKHFIGFSGFFARPMKLTS
jgi:hypothetical protein